MAVRDLEAFLREIATEWDPSLDISEGSPFDVKVVQRVLRRLGTDPFTVDMATFIQTRLRQAYPDVAFDEGGPLTDLMVKPTTLLFDPLTRENVRVAGSLSFADPGSLTVEEAEALGANVFSNRETGEYAKGVGRLLFAQPQNIGITPDKFFTSKGGLHFFPQETQSIRGEEMLINLNEDGLYYFDTNLIAEAAGSAYNIDPGSLVSVANIPSAVRVTNLKRFTEGLNEETAAEFIYRAQQELTERALVTLRGISAKITRSYPEVQRLNVVGFNDPEMQRDVITGGGLGGIVTSGIAGVPVPDGDGAAKTRRFYTAEVDFTAEVASAGSTSGYYITIYGATGVLNHGRDFAIIRIVSATEVDVDEQEMSYTALGPCAWAVRKKELTLSGIPGGILYPDSQFGTVTIQPDEVHIGGTTDVYIRGTELEDATLTITAAVDDEPASAGTSATQALPNLVTLDDYTLGGDYSEGDTLYEALVNAGFHGYTLQLQTGTNAGSYRIIGVTQILGFSPVVTTSPDLPNPPSGSDRWRLVDELTIDLTNPKETFISGSDLEKVQSSSLIGTSGLTDFDALGAAKDNILRISEGPDEGDYSLVEDPIAPGFTTLRLSSDMTFTETGVSYELFKPNPDGGIELPLVRISSIELLDSSNQPQGTTVPYAKPVDIQTRAFQNPARGIKHDWVDATLGLVSADLSTPFVVTGTLTFSDFQSTTVITFMGESSIAAIVATINAGLSSSYGMNNLCVLVGATHFGIRPFGLGGRVAIVDGSAVVLMTLFGSTDIRTSCDVRSASVSPSWGALDPAVDFVTGLDVVQVLTGNQVGFYPTPYTIDWNPWYSTLSPSEALVMAQGDALLEDATVFSPEVGVRMQVGARSLGSARMYFLEPTTLEVDSDTYFSATGDSGTVRFIPDPSLSTQLLPPLPGNVPIKDGEVSVTPSTVFTSSSQDFVISRVQPGDELSIKYWPLTGTIPMADPVPLLAGKTLVYSIDSGPNRSLTFVRDSTTIPATDVSLPGVVDQINASFGTMVCSLVGGGFNELEFEADMLIVIQETGTSNELILGNIAGTAPALSFHSAGPDPLGNDVQRSNWAPMYGIWAIDNITSPTVLNTVSNLARGSDFLVSYPGPLLARQSYEISRPSTQRISTTDMRENAAEADLYYFDVELVSEGTGDLWNIDADMQMTVEGYRSDGWYLTTEDSNLTFSTVEKVRLNISRAILPDGVDDDPANAIQISGQNLHVTYDRSPVVEDVQGYISSDIERVVCSSPLSRYLTPYFIRFDLTYTGGSKVDVMQPALEKLIWELYPSDTLQSSQVQKVFLNRGATGITNPLDLIALVHEVDRTVTARRSQDAVGTDNRLCTFIPDVLNITRDVS